jgi:non-ribosomal peptide synthase protein (TIGR01720 family)
MEFLGRKDSQVKIRGFRIELGEIESLLLNHEAVKEAVAVAREEEGDKYLCAYIVSDIELRGIELREYLLDKLPTYMVPAYFVRLEKLPLTAGGKVDRRSLPQPGETAMASGIDYAAPASVIEKTLAEIWKGVLARETIGVNDNFFMIGGDSIKSLQIASRMNEAGYRLEIKDLFRYPSISALAPRVTVAERTADQSVVAGTIPLTPIQSEFFQRSKTAPHHYNQAVMFFSAAGFDEEAVKTVLMKIQEHHDALRMSYEEGGGKIVQTNHGLSYPFSLQVYDLRKREDVRQVLEARMNEIQASINLQNGPLLKPALFHLDDGDRLLMVAHHLVIDGLSWRILFEDIEHLYRQYQRGETFSLPPKTDSFKTWAEALTAYADKEAVLREKPYWARLESVSVPVIPRDFERGTNYRKDAERLSFSLDEEKTSHLLMDVNRAFATEINDILLTALGLGIRQTFGHEKVLLTVEGHGRQEISKELDVSRTVGWFTTVYPLLLEVSYADDLARQIKEIKESLRQVPNKGIGYGILKYLASAVHIEEMDFSSNPQIGFNYLGQFDVDLEQISFRVAEESVGTIQSPREEREFELEVAGLIADNRLVMSVTFNKNQFKRETVEVLLNRFQTELCRIISYCLSREKRELTPSDLTYRGLSIAVLDRLAAQYPIEDIYTLSPMQEGMLFHALYDPSSTAYFMQISYRLHVHGRLEVSRVKESLNVLMARYQVLRTAFIYEGLDRPLQVVLNEHQIDFYYEDIREATTEKREAFIGEFKDRDRRVGFDLGKGRLMRVALIRLGYVEYEFIWGFHHILMDGWCTGILISEFFRIYHTLLENRPVRLPPARAYKTYIEWLEQQNREESRNYWLNYLDGYDRAAGISNINRVKAPGKGYKNEQIVMAVTEKVTADLNKLARRNHVTLNTTLQTAWGILLGKYNGSRDVVFGAAVSGRPAEVEGVESMVGLFTNTIPVRIRYEDGDTRENRFNELLREVQQAAVDSEPHHYYPLAEIQSRSILKQDLIDHILVFESFPTAQQIDVHDDTGEEEQVGAAVELLAMELHSQTNYDFNLILVPGERLTLRFMYNAGVYEREFVDRTLRHFLRIIEQVLLDEAIPVTELTLLTAEEKSESIKMVKDQRGQSSTEDAKTESDRFDNREANFNF